jgi:chromosome partitioning protein
VLLGKVPAAEVIIHAESADYDILPTNGDLTAAEVELMNMMVAREQRLRQALEPIRDDYDFILVDCPPSLNMLTLNAMVAADSVMIPMQCEYYALEGLSALLNTIEEIRGSVNPNLEIEGLLRTMYDPRNNLATDVSGQLIMHFGDNVYRTVIPRNVRLAEAPSHGIPAIKYDRTSRGAVAYLALAGEILRRSGGQQPHQAAV